MPPRRWQRFEAFRNRLPLIDHSVIGDAEASDLAGSYSFSNLTRFLTRILQLSHGEAAARVRAAAAVGARSSMLGEHLEPQLPKLAALQREGVVSAEKVQIVERAMHQLSRSGIDPEAVQTAEQLLTDYAPLLAPADLHRYALKVVDAADPDGPEPVDEQLQHDRRYLELKLRRDGMWWLQGKLSGTVGAQLNAILDPLTKPRRSSLDDHNANTTVIPDERPYGQRLHDGLDEVCGRVLKMQDQPISGGTPASVIVTIDIDELLAKAGLAETSDGSMLTPQQLLQIADEAEIWPTIINRNGIPLALGRTQRLASKGQTMALTARDGGCSFPGCTHPPSWCDRHHILDWIRGGLTDVDNMTLLVPVSPHSFPAKRLELPHQYRRTTRMDPAQVDRPTARPQQNTRIRRLHAQQQEDLRRRRPAAAA